jgi:homogentisate 1,2-dioxygenase
MTMNINTSPDVISRSTVGVTPGYMSGFGNSFETEALPGALPIGRNSPTSVRGSIASGRR